LGQTFSPKQILSDRNKNKNNRFWDPVIAGAIYKLVSTRAVPFFSKKGTALGIKNYRFYFF